MHEHVQERAGEQEQEGQIAERVRAVFRQKQKGGDQDKADRYNARLRSPKAGLPWIDIVL
jgi:phage gp16-like protein